MFHQNLDPNGRRRGVVLILILGMLALLALIGVTFASFSGQAQIGARYFAQANYRPTSQELMDYALDQLISGTQNPLSAIRGHELSRDMYGNDSGSSGHSVGMLTSRPDNGLPMLVQGMTVVTSPTTLPNGQSLPAPFVKIGTNIAAADPAFYGLSFSRWSMKVANCTGFAPDGSPVNAVIPPVPQAFEILYEDASGNDSTYSGVRVFYVISLDVSTTLYNPRNATFSGLMAPTQGYPFMLDGRFLRAFNGPGVTGLNHLDPNNKDLNGNQLYIHAGMYGNYRVNGSILSPAGNSAVPALGHPNLSGLDEDYDAPDLENWFLAVQSADGQTIIPSFHRPGIIQTLTPTGVTPAVTDWNNTPGFTSQLSANLSQAKILRPRQIDHPTGNFPDLLPNANGQITYDVDNDGDGTTDSVWLDLGFPVQRDAQGRLYKPLYAFLIIGLNGRMPLNTVGNIQGRDIVTGYPTYDHTSHLGYSVNEINPKYALDAGKQDNAGIDVSVTQLRNLLTGTRPQPNPYVPSASMGDSNFLASKGIYMPNNIADNQDSSLVRSVPAVTGRWGERGGIPAILYQMQSGDPVTSGGFDPLAFNNYVRAGHSPSSLGWGELSNATYTPNAAYRQDATDDDFDTFDPFPSAATGEYGDFYDNAGGLLLPSERIRRFTTPIDPSGNGLAVDWGNSSTEGITTGAAPSPYGMGFDVFGRVSYWRYFRPPGVPLEVTYANNDYTRPFAGVLQAVIPDLTNNLYHGYEAARMPSNPASTTPLGMMAAMPYNTPTGLTSAPTYDQNINWDSPLASLIYPFGSGAGAFGTGNEPVVTNGYLLGSLNRDEADEMNLYRPSQYDDPYGPEDLEWLYRAQDFDGNYLYSRLSQLAPVSFLNSVRQRRLFSVDSWDSNAYAWAPPNAVSPAQGGQGFVQTNLYGPNTLANGGFLGQAPYNVTATAPTIANRSRKINLNFPLPVSNDPLEPVRQKWISETYSLLKHVLPATSIDSPYELAQLSQFLVNVVDFRDPDSTVTVFQNPDLTWVPAQGTTPAAVNGVGGGGLSVPLVQYGMEYQPIAINEVLAFQYNSKGGNNADTPVKRMFFEVVNMLTRDGTATVAPYSTDLNMEGWDFVIAPDSTTAGRPDPITGQIYLNNSSISTIKPTPPAPIYPMTTRGTPLTTLIPAMDSAQQQQPYRISYNMTNVNNYYYVFGDISMTANQAEAGLPQIEQKVSLVNYLPTLPTGANPQFYWLYLRRPVNPMDSTGVSVPEVQARLNPNAQSYYDGMVVVDAFRFAYTESGFSGQVLNGQDSVKTAQQKGLYSLQRLQPFRGGHAVAVATTAATQMIPPGAYGYSEQTDAPNSGTYYPMWGSYKYPNAILNTIGYASSSGAGNANSVDPTWDHFPFLDRDFTSLAELTLVPGCPPGLFTKQFVEFPPPLNVPNYSTGGANSTYPSQPYISSPGTGPSVWPYIGIRFNNRTSNYPRTYPYLLDNFFYTAVSDPNVVPLPNSQERIAGGINSAGWHQMLEFFEVPSSANGAIGPVVTGVNFDWYRQDLKPGLLNVNLIIDQEVFLGLVDDLRLNTLPAGIGKTPRVVTQIDQYGYPLSWHNVSTPTPGSLTGAFSDFLKLRSGGSPFLFAHGAGLTNSPATPANLLASPPNTTYSQVPPLSLTPQMWSDRWYHSLSYPDIGLTIMRPAFLPPANIIAGSTSPITLSYLGFGAPGANSAQQIQIAAPAANSTWQFNSGVAPYWQADPAWKNPYLTWMVSDNLGIGNPVTIANPYITGIIPGTVSAPATGGGNVAILQPPPIPPRRLFQIPDEGLPYTSGLPANTGTNPPNYFSNAAENPSAPPITGGGGQPVSVNQILVQPSLSNNYSDLVQATTLTAGSPPVNFLGSGMPALASLPQDQRTHPAYRIELLQKVMNLTTVRTHQFAVWITVGLFEVVRPGNPIYIDPNTGFNVPIPDQLGPELDLYSGRNVRYRSFFVVDRTKITGFGDRIFPPDFHDAVTYRRRIQ